MSVSIEIKAFIYKLKTINQSLNFHKLCCHFLWYLDINFL